MRGKKLSAEQMNELLSNFEAVVVPWCEEYKLSLHKAFEASREDDIEIDKQRYYILSELWHTQFGKIYLQSYFRSRGGRLGLENK